MKPYSRQFLLNLYRTMLRIRLFEEHLAEAVLAGEIKTPCHLYVGQEAVAAGVCAALKKTDYIFGTHRSHGHYLAKGADMNSLMAEIYGKETGCSRGHGGSMHIIQQDVGVMGAQPLVAGTIPVAVGSALASSIKGDGRVTAVFFGDGAVEEGVFHESINFAGIKKLPVIFVCENNLYSSHLHIRERRPVNNIYKTGGLFNILQIRVDGNNVLKVYEKAKKAVAAARDLSKPVIIEAMTYRLRGHVGAVDKVADQDITDIRDETEVAFWLKRDPITLFKKYILRLYPKFSQSLIKVEQMAKREVSDSCAFAQKSAPPASTDLHKYLFAICG